MTAVEKFLSIKTVPIKTSADKSKSISYRKCMGCHNCWNETPETTNKCSTCGCLLSISITEVFNF